MNDLAWAGQRHRVGAFVCFQPTPESKAAQCDLLLSARVHVGLPAPPSTFH
jgi:hypothetical protein